MPRPRASVLSDGPAIRALRQRHGWTVEDLQARLAEKGVAASRGHLFNVEANHRRASLALLQAIADVLGVSVVLLVERSAA